VKELWIEIPQTSKEKGRLLSLANKTADVTIENNQASNSAGTLDLVFLTELNEKNIAQLKSEGKKTVLQVSIQGKDDENKAAKAAELGVDYIIINCLDWRVIPLENLIAKSRGKSKLFAEVNTAEDAKVVLDALELGTDGVLLKTSDPEEILKTIAVVKPETLKLEMAIAKITSAKPISTGARVCVDTCDMMSPGEGMLVGSQSAGLFLVEAEVHENPYVASRPFRVNAGSLSMYTLGTLQTTRYLSELKAGEEVIIVDREGKTRKTNVGRVKIEIRPLLLVEAQVEGKTIKTILQNAETIRLVTPTASKPVTELKPNDEVLVHLAAKGGRHFGISVPEETVIEK
jgi:3-dehydroquinate synthase II